MGYIKEPKGVDFIVKSAPLTKEESEELAEFFRQDKLKHKKKR